MKSSSKIMLQESSDVLAKNRIVLLGVGHTNAHVLAKWKMEPIPDSELICVSKFPIATYSGMLPAVLAQQQPVSSMEIDLVALCASANATLILGDVNGLDRQKRELLFSDRPAVEFDALSIGIGSVPQLKQIEIDSANVISIKPMQTFLTRLENLIKANEKHAGSKLKIAVIGGGAAGVEISCCLKSYLKVQADFPQVQITLVNRSDKILSGSSDGMRKRVTRALARNEIAVSCSSDVVQITNDKVLLKSGEQLDADIVIMATGAAATPLLQRLGLPLSDSGFLLTDNTLKTIAGDPIFIVGDTGTMLSHPVDKAGVFAVRQGPILWENIQREVARKPLKQFRPQKRTLRILNTGDGSAIAEKGRLSVEGQWVLALKNLIDNRFMRKYQTDLSVSDEQNMDIPDKMHCRGCGAKLGSAPLFSALEELSVSHDDAALIKFHSEKVVISTDFFPTPFRDPWLNGRVAAIHAVNDVWAMGALPIAVVNQLVVPHGKSASQEKYVADALAGANHEFSLMAVERHPLRVEGGHTCVGPQSQIGFTVLGELLGELPFTKSAARPGDLIYLNKPLGSGLLLAAQRRAKCSAAAWMELVDLLTTHSERFAIVAHKSGVEAATDVSGFGLIGHLMEVVRFSGVRANLHLDAIPVINAAVKLSEQGLRSSLFPENYKTSQFVDGKITDPIVPLLYDPQTSGGLLCCVPAAAACQFETECESVGVDYYRIGSIEPHTPERKSVSILS